MLSLSGAAMGIAITGCIEAPFTRDDVDDPTDEIMDDGFDDGNTDDMNDTNSNGDGIRDVQFEVLEVTGSDYELAATASFESGRFVVSGTISGNNSCYSARVGKVMVENQSVTIDIQSFDDADPDEGCLEILVGISYEAIVEFDGELPKSVVVSHNGEKVTTAYRP